MRDVKRIAKCLKALGEIWTNEFPDLRLGQLFFNFNNWLSTKKKIDIFFPEDDRLIELMQEYVQYLKEEEK